MKLFIKVIVLVALAFCFSVFPLILSIACAEPGFLFFYIPLIIFAIIASIIATSNDDNRQETQ